MASCLPQKTSKNLKRPCDPKTPGVRPVIYQGCISQLVAGALALATGDDKTLTSIPLKTGEKLTKIEGYKNSHAFSTTFNNTDTAKYTPHLLNTVIYDQSSTGAKQTDILKDLTDLFFVAKENGLTGPWRVFGIKTGMECTGQSSNFNDPNGSAVAMTFEAAYELETPLFLKHITDLLDDTDSYIEGLALVDA